MGRRSRKRTVSRTRAAGSASTPRRSGAPAPRASSPPRPRTLRARRSEAPPAPWSPLPLVELSILGGIGLLVAGLLSHGPRGRVELGCGLALIMLASLELAIREHFAGYRSHTTLLAGAVGVATMALLAYLTGLPRYVIVVIALSLFAFLWRLLRGAFQRRSGGFGFRA